MHRTMVFHFLNTLLESEHASGMFSDQKLQGLSPIPVGQLKDATRYNRVRSVPSFLYCK